MSKRTNKDTLREIRLRTFAIEVVKGKTPQEAYRKAHGGKQYKSNALTHMAWGAMPLPAYPHTTEQMNEIFTRN